MLKSPCTLVGNRRHGRMDETWTQRGSRKAVMISTIYIKMSNRLTMSNLSSKKWNNLKFSNFMTLLFRDVALLQCQALDVPDFAPARIWPCNLLANCTSWHCGSGDAGPSPQTNAKVGKLRSGIVGVHSDALFFAQSLNMLAFRSDPSSPSLPRPPLSFISFDVALFASTSTGTPVLLALPAKSESTPTTHHHPPPPTTSAGHGWKSLTPAMDDSIPKCPNPLHQNFMKRSI